MQRRSGAEGDWVAYAYCRRPEYEADWWYADQQSDEPGGTQEKSARQTLRAKLVCASCPVRGACLTQAARDAEEFGIWGGYTAEERELLMGDARVALRAPDDVPLSAVEHLAISLFVEDRMTTAQIQANLRARGVDLRVSDILTMLHDRTYGVREA